MRALQAQHQGHLQEVVEEITMGVEATEKAQKNLALVCKALHVKSPAANVFEIRVGATVFHVTPGAAHIIGNGTLIQSTCIQSGGMPTAEVIATVLLLLHHDPHIFHRWHDDQGTLYGA
jgi:hypothetical protein